MVYYLRLGFSELIIYEKAGTVIIPATTGVTMNVAYSRRTLIKQLADLMLVLS